MPKKARRGREQRADHLGVPAIQRARELAAPEAHIRLTQIMQEGERAQPLYGLLVEPAPRRAVQPTSIGGARKQRSHHCGDVLAVVSKRQCRVPGQLSPGMEYALPRPTCDRGASSSRRQGINLVVGVRADHRNELSSKTCKAVVLSPVGRLEQCTTQGI